MPGPDWQGDETDAVLWVATVDEATAGLAASISVTAIAARRPNRCTGGIYSTGADRPNVGIFTSSGRQNLSC